LYQGEEKKGDIHQPLDGTWVADFMLRQDAGRFMLGKYQSDKKNPSVYFGDSNNQNLYFKDSNHYQKVRALVYSGESEAKPEETIGMAVAGNTLTASFLTKIGKMQSAGCRLCRIARGPRREH